MFDLSAVSSACHWPRLAILHEIVSSTKKTKFGSAFDNNVYTCSEGHGTLSEIGTNMVPPNLKNKGQNIKHYFSEVERHAGCYSFKGF